MQPREQITREQSALLRTLQRESFNYFIHHTNPANGLVADKSREGWPASIAAVGMALGAYPVAVEVTTGDQTQELRTAFAITAHKFPVQYLKMSKESEAKYEAPSVEDEYRQIYAALGLETPRVWQGPFRVPIEGEVSTWYGSQRYRNGKRVSLHKGVDIAAPRGTPIYAANAGTVVLVRNFTMHGKAIAIDHGSGVVGLYLHLNEFVATEGQHVEAGDLIGRVGNTGVGTGPHLHYALYVHSTAVDPFRWKDVPEGW